MLENPDIHLANTALTTSLAFLGVGLSAVALAAAAIPTIRKNIIPKPLETRLADFLPFKTILNDGMTVELKDGSKTRFIELRGVDQTFLTGEELYPLYASRKKILDDIAEKGVNLRIYTRRVRVPVIEADEKWDIPIADAIAKRWNRQFERSFENRMVIAVTCPKDDEENSRLGDACSSIIGTMNDYQPTILTQNLNDSIERDMSITKFLTSIISPLSAHHINGTGSNLADTLTSDTVEFMNDGFIRFSNGNEEVYTSIMGLRRLGDSISSSLSAALATCPFEIDIIQVVEPQSKLKSMTILTQNKSMMGNMTFSPAVTDQFNMAIEMAEGNDQTNRSALCNFSEIIICRAKTKEEIEEAENEIRRMMQSVGFTVVRERGVSQASFFMQMPGVDIWPRIYRLFSANIAHFATFNRPSKGYPSSDWGNGPIARFITAGNTVHNHQFHATDATDALGHGLCIAPSGGGKTVLFSFLSMMATRHENTNVFIFDRFKGAYVYTTAMGGKYLNFNADPLAMTVGGGMNPFQCKDTERNRSFLTQWLKQISGCTDIESSEQIARAIDIAFSTLEPEERSLAMIYETAFTPNSPIAEALRPWVEADEYGPLFNAKSDCLNLTDNRIVTFDMSNIFEDPQLAAASTSYILHKIRSSMIADGKKALIFIDETEPMLKNEQFKANFMVMLQEFRKLGGAVISVFQRPEALEATGVGQTVRSQSAVYYLFPNAGANIDDYAAFNLNENEKLFIKKNHPMTSNVQRGILLKRPETKETTVIDVDLNPIGHYKRIFASGSQDVMRAHKLQQEYKEDWLQHYLQLEEGL